MADNFVERYEELVIEAKSLKDQNRLLLNHLAKHGLLENGEDGKLTLTDGLPTRNQPDSAGGSQEDTLQPDGEQIAEGVDTQEAK